LRAIWQFFWGGGSLFKSIVNQGGKGVQLFFVASAFTLFFSLSKKKLTHNVKYNFYVRRIFRIAPLYYLGIIYYLMQDGLGPRFWLGDAPGITSWHIISNVLFLHGFDPYAMSSVVPGGWSIAVEMLFYCFVPFLFLRIKSLNQAIAFLMISILLNLFLYLLLNRLNLISDTRLWGNYLNLFFPSQLPVFACGIIMFFLITVPKTEWKINPGFILGLGLLFLLDLSLGFSVFFGSHILFSITFIAIGFALSRKEFKILVNPASVYIGKISYSMYIVHFAILHWLTQLNLINLMPSNSIANYCLRFVFVLILSTFFATITYHLVEVPFQKLGAKLVGGQVKPN
jgi:peptidoglycan/LPS O-acetylase OafA/YrhL